MTLYKFVLLIGPCRAQIGLFLLFFVVLSRGFCGWTLYLYQRGGLVVSIKLIGFFIRVRVITLVMEIFLSVLDSLAELYKLIESLGV